MNENEKIDYQCQIESDTYLHMSSVEVKFQPYNIYHFKRYCTYISIEKYVSNARLMEL